MKKYDHEDDENYQVKQKQGDKKDRQQKQKLDYMENDFNFSKIQSELNQIQYQLKSQNNAIKKIQKDLESKVNQALITQTIALINSGIHSDPNIIKLLKTRQDLSEKDDENQLKLNSNLFARKLNQMSQCLTILLGNIRKVQSKVNLVQADISSQINERFNNASAQMDELKSDTTKQFMQIQQKTQLISFQLTDKLRQMQTKLNWRLNEFKTRIDEKMSEQLVKIYLQNIQKKLQKDMKQFQIKSNIDPQRIEHLQFQINNNRIKAQDGITKNKYQIQNIQFQIKNQLIRKQYYNQEQIKIQKRLQLFNDNFTDVYNRVKKCQYLEIGLDQNITKLVKDNDYELIQLKRINTVLLNLKIGQDFQRMLQEMNPTKVLELQDRVEEVKSQQTNIFRQIAFAKRQIETIHAKSEIIGFMQPNKQRQKLKKQQINEALNNFLIQNQFGHKISNIDKQLNEYKLSVESINLLTRQMARLQKQSDFNKLSFQLKALQQHFKRQLTLINNKIKDYNTNLQINATSQRIMNIKQVGQTIIANQSFGNKSFSVKKMNNVTRQDSFKRINSQKIKQLTDLKFNSKI